MPWKPEDIAKYPMLTDKSSQGVELLRLSKSAFYRYWPEKIGLWDEVNPMVRNDFMRTVKAVKESLIADLANHTDSIDHPSTRLDEHDRTCSYCATNNTGCLRRELLQEAIALHSDSPMIAVPREFLIEQRKEWLEINDPQDGTDCVTPFDKFFY